MAREIFIFSPLPPLKSGIAEYTHIVAQELIARFGYPVHVVVDQEETPKNINYRSHHWKEFLYGDIDPNALLIYQIGNSSLHNYIYPFLFSHPGMVVLHDFLLGHSRLKTLSENYTYEEILAELTYNLGNRRGKHLARVIRVHVRELLPFIAMLNREVIESALQLVLHNPDTESFIRRKDSSIPTRCFPMALWDASALHDVPPELLLSKRRQLEIEEDALIMGTFGIINPYKQIEALLKTVRILRDQSWPVYLLIVGYMGERVDLPAIIEGHNVRPYVRVMTDISRKDYRELLSLTDVCYSLRLPPPVGEFSLSVLEQMASAKPVIMNQHRFNAYIPENVCVKVRSSLLVESLVEKTKWLLEEATARKTIGAQARDYVRTQNSLDVMMEGYRKSIEFYDVYRRRWVDRRAQFPSHLRPLRTRALEQLRLRLGPEFPPVQFNELEQLI